MSLSLSTELQNSEDVADDASEGEAVEGGGKVLVARQGEGAVHATMEGGGKVLVAKKGEGMVHAAVKGGGEVLVAREGEGEVHMAVEGGGTLHCRPSNCKIVLL